MPLAAGAVGSLDKQRLLKSLLCTAYGVKLFQDTGGFVTHYLTGKSTAKGYFLVYVVVLFILLLLVYFFYCFSDLEPNGTVWSRNGAKNNVGCLFRSWGLV